MSLNEVKDSLEQEKVHKSMGLEEPCDKGKALQTKLLFFQQSILRFSSKILIIFKDYPFASVDINYYTYFKSFFSKILSSTYTKLYGFVTGFILKVFKEGFETK